MREGIIRSDWIAKMIDRVHCRLFSIRKWSYSCSTAETIAKVTVERDRFIDNLWSYEGNIEKVKPALFISFTNHYTDPPFILGIYSSYILNELKAVLYQFPQAVREGGCRRKDNSNSHQDAIC